MISRLWVEGPLPGMNEMLDAAKGAGGHGSNYARLKRAWTDTVWALARNARLPVFFGPVFLTFVWVEKDRRRDPDNIAAGGKKVTIDGLVQARVLGGDGWKHVLGWRDSFKVGRPGVEVTIYGGDDLPAEVTTHARTEAAE